MCPAEQEYIDVEAIELKFISNVVGTRVAARSLDLFLLNLLLITLPLF